MEWSKDKPQESGWYEFRGRLYQSYVGDAPYICDPCTVQVEFREGSEPSLTRQGGSFPYDFNRAEGDWNGPVESAPEGP